MIIATIPTRARTQDASLPRFSPFKGGGGEGKETRFEVVPLYTRIYRERSQEGEGWWCVTPPRGMNERNESGGGGGRKESRRRASFRTVLEKVVWPYTFTDLHYPRLAPTLDTHHRPPQIVPLQRRVRGAAGRPAGTRRHRCDPLNDTPPPPPCRAQPPVSPLLDEIMSRWRAHLGRNSSRPGLDNNKSRSARQYARVKTCK